MIKRFSSSPTSLDAPVAEIDEKNGYPVDPRSTSLLGRAVTKARGSRTFVATVGFAFAVVAMQMAQGILLARLLGVEGRGQYAATVTYVQILLYVGLFGGLEVVCRYAADAAAHDQASGDADRRQYRLRRAALWLGLTTGVTTTLIALPLSLFGMPAGKEFLAPLAALCAFSLIGQQVMLIMTGVDRGSGHFTAYNWRRVFAAGAFPTLLLGCFLVWKVDVPIACGLFVIASLLSMLVCLIGLPEPFRGESAPPVPRLLKESRPYGLSMLATDLFERLDLLLVMWMVPLATQGLYASMVPVVYPLTVIPNTLGLFLFNAGADSSKRLRRRDVHRILGASLAVQAATLIPFLIVVGPLVRLVYGEEFSAAVTFAWWLAPVSALKGILQGLDSYVKGRGRPLASITCRILAAIVMLIVTFALIGRVGAIAIAVAALVGQIVCLVWISAIVYADCSDR